MVNNPHPVIASIVEGHGEEKALLGLLHRLVPHLREGAYAHIPPPYRLPRDRMLKPEPLAQALTIVTARRPSPPASSSCSTRTTTAPSTWPPRYATSRRTAMHTSP